ncbi:hypothetical protein [Micropruina sp.]|uniref:hypothetical protein n=1 Tax=Micropruina sp. TaxID=2737536 RepID=UPI0039E38925
MTNQPGSGWPQGPPPQGPGPTPPAWGAQQLPPGVPYPGQGPQYPNQSQQPRPSAMVPSGFDPRRALGEAPPASVSINQFAPPPNRTPLLVTIVAMVTLVLVIGGGIYLRSQPAAQPSPSPSASPTASTGPGHPFDTPTGQQRGRWEILDQTWTDEGLQLQLRIYSDNGPISFSFVAFANASTQVIAPTSSPRSPDIRTGTATPSKPITGYVFFPMPHEDGTIILATGAGLQMSALPVKA